MKANMMKVTAAAALVLGMMGAAHATGTLSAGGKDATVTISGGVTASSCDVVVDKTALDIGNVPLTGFAGLAKGAVAGVYGIADTAEVTLENCGTAVAPGSSELIFAAPMAQDADANDTAVAWGDPSKSLGFGFMINATPAGGDNGTAKDLSFNNNVLELDTAKVTGTDLDKLKATIAPYMIKTIAAAPTPGRLTVPMTISYIHN